MTKKKTKISEIKNLAETNAKFDEFLNKLSETEKRQLFDRLRETTKLDPFFEMRRNHGIIN